MESEPTDIPLLTPNRERGTWILEADWGAHIRFKDQSYKIVIPKGFESDGGTIPTWLEWIVENDEFMYEFLIHDYLYNSKLYSKSIVDSIMYSQLKKAVERKIQAFRRLESRSNICYWKEIFRLRLVPITCWFAVYLFGKVAWDDRR